MSALSSLHGPFWPRNVVDFYGKPPNVKSRVRRVNALPFRWIQSGDGWVEDNSAFVPVTLPEPIPDYTPEELARIAAAEAKRARKGA